MNPLDKNNVYVEVTNEWSNSDKMFQEKRHLSHNLHYVTPIIFKTVKVYQNLIVKVNFFLKADHFPLFF